MEGGSQDSQESSREPREAVAKTGPGEMRLHYRWELVAKEVQRSMKLRRHRLDRHWRQSLRKDGSDTDAIFSVAPKGFHSKTQVGSRLNYTPQKSGPKSPQISRKCS